MEKIKIFLLEEFMEKKRLDRAGFADLCGIDYNTLCKIYAGNYDFDISFLFKIARVLSVSIHQLFGEEGC